MRTARKPLIFLSGWTTSDYISAIAVIKTDIYRVYANGVGALKYSIDGWVQLQKPVPFQGCKPEEDEKSL